jgi:hypothetical protein
MWECEDHTVDFHIFTFPNFHMICVFSPLA